MISEALGEGDMAQSDEKGENFMKENIFENGNEDNGAVLSHADATKFATEVFNDMGKYGSFKESFLAHAGTYGIDDISYLFPDARTLDNEPRITSYNVCYTKLLRLKNSPGVYFGKCLPEELPRFFPGTYLWTVPSFQEPMKSGLQV